MQPITFPDLLAAWLGDRPKAEGARLLGVSWNTFQTWIRGEVVPPRSKRSLIAAVIGAPVEQLEQAIASTAVPSGAAHAPRSAW